MRTFVLNKLVNGRLNSNKNKFSLHAVVSSKIVIDKLNRNKNKVFLRCGINTTTRAIQETRSLDQPDGIPAHWYVNVSYFFREKSLPDRARDLT